MERALKFNGSCQASCRSFSSRSCPLQARQGPRKAVRLTRVKASRDEDAMKQMTDFKAGLSEALQSAEADMKQQASSGRMRVMAAAVEDTDKSLRELNSDDFYPFLEGAGERLVVVDFYTDWCGPCKVMLPMLEDLAQELSGKAEIVKFNCNARNKDLGKELNIKVAPTFHVYKNSNKVAEMTGAKIDELKELIEENL